MKKILLRSLINAGILSIIDIIVNAIPAVIKINYLAFIILASIVSVGIIIFIIISGYKIGKEYQIRDSILSGAIIGIIIGTIPGYVNVYIQSHSILYKQMFNAFVQSLTNGARIPTSSISTSAYIEGIIMTTLFYSILSIIGAFFGNMKKVNENVI